MLTVSSLTLQRFLWDSCYTISMHPTPSFPGLGFYGLPLMGDFRGLGRLRHKQRSYHHFFPDCLVWWKPGWLGQWLLANETGQLTSPGTQRAYGVRVNIYLHLMCTVLRLFVYLFNRQLGFTEKNPFVLCLGYRASELWKTAFGQACPSLGVWSLPAAAALIQGKRNTPT